MASARTASRVRPRAPTKKKTLATAPRDLPAALAKRATAAAAAKKARLVREARGLLDLVARRKSAITEAFYDIGVALAALKAKEMVAALGRRSFAEVCEQDAGLSASTGERLVGIVASMTRDQALSMGQSKAMAMVSLAAATPEDDTPAGLFRKKSVVLPDGRTLSPRTATARAVEAAAVAVRRSRKPKSAAATTKRGRGRTTTSAERELAAMLQKQLRHLGLARATVTAVATKPGQGADLRFERIPAAQIDVLRKAIGR